MITQQDCFELCLTISDAVYMEGSENSKVLVAGACKLSFNFNTTGMSQDLNRLPSNFNIKALLQTFTKRTELLYFR